MFFQRNKFKVDGKLVVITGGSQGCGVELAKQIFSRGANVIIVARTESKLKEAVSLIEKKRVNETQTVTYVSADISDYSECERVLNIIDVPDIVVCCAGSSILGLFTELTSKELEDGIKINYHTALYFSHAAIKKMTKVSPNPKDPRHIVLFSSVVAFYPFLGYGQYAPLKAAIRALADLLRQEVLTYNIKVECVFPGNFMSEGFLEEEKTKPEITKIIEGPSTPISGEECAKIVLKGLDRGYEMITTDTIGYLLGSSMLGASPRCFGFLQVILGLLLSILAPIASIFVDQQIVSYFRKRNLERVPIVKEIAESRRGDPISSEQNETQELLKKESESKHTVKSMI